MLFRRNQILLIMVTKKFLVKIFNYVIIFLIINKLFFKIFRSNQNNRGNFAN